MVHPLCLPEIITRIGHCLPLWKYTPTLGFYDFSPAFLLACTRINKTWYHSLLPIIWFVYCGHTMRSIPAQVILKNSGYFRLFFMDRATHSPDVVPFRTKGLRELEVTWSGWALKADREESGGSGRGWLNGFVGRNAETLRCLSWKGNVSASSSLSSSSSSSSAPPLSSSSSISLSGSSSSPTSTLPLLDCHLLQRMSCSLRHLKLSHWRIPWRFFLIFLQECRHLESLALASIDWIEDSHVQQEGDGMEQDSDLGLAIHVQGPEPLPWSSSLHQEQQPRLQPSKRQHHQHRYPTRSSRSSPYLSLDATRQPLLTTAPQSRPTRRSLGRSGPLLSLPSRPKGGMSSFPQPDIQPAGSMPQQYPQQQHPPQQQQQQPALSLPQYDPSLQIKHLHLDLTHSTPTLPPLSISTLSSSSSSSSHATPSTPSTPTSHYQTLLRACPVLESLALLSESAEETTGLVEVLKKGAVGGLRAIDFVARFSDRKGGRDFLADETYAGLVMICPLSGAGATGATAGLGGGGGAAGLESVGMDIPQLGYRLTRALLAQARTLTVLDLRIFDGFTTTTSSLFSSLSTETFFTPLIPPAFPPLTLPVLPTAPNSTTSITTTHLCVLLQSCAGLKSFSLSFSPHSLGREETLQLLDQPWVCLELEKLVLMGVTLSSETISRQGSRRPSRPPSPLGHFSPSLWSTSPPSPTAPSSSSLFPLTTTTSYFQQHHHPPQQQQQQQQQPFFQHPVHRVEGGGAYYGSLAKDLLARQIQRLPRLTLLSLNLVNYTLPLASVE